jgi:hypothetical protein
MGRDAMFTHSALGRSAKGLVSQEELGAADRVRLEGAAKGDAVGPAVALRMDGGQSRPPVAVNRAERMHVCHSICCKLDFLTASEVESGAIRCDLGRPYQIRHEADGYCTHRNRESGFCGVYDLRPGICRGYSCANDKRIWKDFERMELNREWLDDHLSGRTAPRVSGAMLYGIEPAAVPAVAAT